MSGSGTGVVAFAEPLQFTAQPWDVIEVCDQVDYTSDDTPTVFKCGEATTTQLIPQDVVDLVTLVLDLVNAVLYETVAADATICPVFQSLAPGNELVVIAPDGDVSIGGEPYWDCPPYVGGPPEQPTWSATGLTGGGWDDGDRGFLTLVSPATVSATYPVATDGPYDVTSTCAFVTDRSTGNVAVRGLTVAGRPGVADATTIHCRLQDADGTVLYDHTESAAGPTATLSDSLPAIAGKVSVCTGGSGTWGTTTASVGPYCRYAA
jgi:hypothetical protein